MTKNNVKLRAVKMNLSQWDMGPDNNSLYLSSHNLNGCGRVGVAAPRIRPHSAPLPSRQLPRHARLSSHAHETSFIASDSGLAAARKRKF